MGLESLWQCDGYNNRRLEIHPPGGDAPGESEVYMTNKTINTVLRILRAEKKRIERCFISIESGKFSKDQKTVFESKLKEVEEALAEIEELIK